MSETQADPTPLRRTPLHDRHVSLGARMVGFAGYDMPVQYKEGILAEHQWTRTHAGLFDVSHMGQCFLVGRDHETVARALETLVPADILNLKPGQQRYSQFLNEDGGVLDDIMVTRSLDPDEDGTLMVVVNAGCKNADFAHLKTHLPSTIKLIIADHRALLALQGPEAAGVLSRHCKGADQMAFMTGASMLIDSIPVHISRSGYSGEDGYEISVRADKVAVLNERLLMHPEVKPIGLGARDSLRLEAGLCLYGHELDVTTSPVEAAIQWSIQKRRREEGGFPGFARISRELKDGPSRKRVGLLPEGRAPAREGTEIVTEAGDKIGTVTSGGFGPTLNGPCAMGYVDAAHSAIGTKLHLMVRGTAMPASIVAMPFVQHRFHRS
jgi:aminomethyltransferase